MQRGSPSIRQALEQVRISICVYVRREQIPVSKSDASTRESLFCSSPKTFPPLRTHRERRERRRHRHQIRRRVGRGRVIDYASNSMRYHETRVHGTKRYHLKASFEAQRFCEKSAAAPKCRPRAVGGVGDTSVRG